MYLPPVHNASRPPSLFIHLQKRRKKSGKGLVFFVSRPSSLQKKSLCYSLTYAQSTLPTPTLLTITCTQVLWFLQCLVRTTVSYSVTTRTRLWTRLYVYTWNQMNPRRSRSPVSVFGLSLYRNPSI
jgi:hypothetical protein